jgi:hypothetical protein
MTRSTSQVVSAALLAVTLLCLGGSLSAAKEPDPVPAELQQLLSRAGEYVVEYEKTWRGLVAEEAYRQMYWDTTRRLHVRNLRSDVVFLKLPGAIPWTTFRDVFEVDGKLQRDRDARLEKLFADTRATALDQVRAIVQEGARHNLGPVMRTVNVPPIALSFLHPSNQARFVFKRKGNCSGVDQAGIEVAATETARPTLVRDESGGDVPVAGKLCLAPENGAVLRTDVEFDLDGSERDRWAWARILVLYGRDARLGGLVPAEMKETYQFAGVGATGYAMRESPTGPGNEIRIESVARYSGFHRLQITTQESFQAAPPAAPPAAAAPPATTTP